MRIPLLDFGRMASEEKGRLEEAFRRVLASGQFILGEEVAAFERECADFLGVAHAIGVSSGTDALLLALQALGIGPGDEVICPSYTFFATAGSIARTGAKPVFADSCPGCWNLSPQEVKRKVTEKTKAVIPVHLFGQPAAMTSLLAVGREAGLAVIEDAAQAFGARSGDQRAGGRGLLGCFSFFPTKNLGALGDAGLVTTQDGALADRIRALRVHGSRVKYRHEWIGGNFRIDALQAAFLRARLPGVEAALAARRRNVQIYEEAFLASGIAARSPDSCRCEGQEEPVCPSSPGQVLLPRDWRGEHTWNQYVIRYPPDRDGLRRFLAEARVQTEVYYPLPLHLQPCFLVGERKGEELPVAELFARESLALPIFPGLSADEIHRVVELVSRFARQRAKET
ncbi:UDP-2-acetamido-2-deoxy-ribo-hexuluronate aminotransferase [Methylacidimicrobium cyclopophantes]|uniref:UDP-2-acetamido-2-deoxy-ribo-hexuluronate aminotransferase n=1 Tax=Methylacidimicrobium cyclopophantes TaxID=1041766 RepID=A0A5E6MCF3_9BACT|nr:DegT/DnrJ/EryC1/StrS family aminotransferase [Methylacidimicrobium cyclopophantes]VVM06918.1 UDP-2-acetamido-2-deoxy-ribo-hexuluronate aminotransferase [Methylacidimicrobium cyclopophantes]